MGIVSRGDTRVGSRCAHHGTPCADESHQARPKDPFASDLGITPQKVQVAVKNGVVTLDGNVESELKRRAIRSLVEGLGIGGYKDLLAVTEAGSAL